MWEEGRERNTRITRLYNGKYKARRTVKVNIRFQLGVTIIAGIAACPALI